MYFLLSPAKSLNETDSIPADVANTIDSLYSQPELIDSTCELMSILKTKEPIDIMDLMKVSDKIAQLNADRNQQWAWSNDKPFSMDADTPAKPAVYLFDGDVYTGLDVYNMDSTSIEWLNNHVGILSGLYGLLKPLDLMLPYRLEMGTKLENNKGINLYQFWDTQISDLINQRLDGNVVNGNVLVNLASNEYFKSVPKKELNSHNIKVITPRFEDEKNGKFKVVSFYAKKARGLMVKYATDNKLTEAEQLKGFDLAGYYFYEEGSDDTNWVFRREER